jgi:hypothetical protein
MARHVRRRSARTERHRSLFRNAAYDFVIEGESYRPRLKPKLKRNGKVGSEAGKGGQEAAR